MAHTRRLAIACAVALFVVSAFALTQAQTPAVTPCPQADACATLVTPGAPPETRIIPPPERWTGILFFRYRQMQVGEGSFPERMYYANATHKRTGFFIEQTVVRSRVLFRGYTLAGARVVNEKRVQVSPYAGYQRHETPARASDNAVVGARVKLVPHKRFSFTVPFLQAELPTTKGALPSFLAVVRPTAQLTKRDAFTLEGLFRKNRGRPFIGEISALYAHRFGKHYAFEGGYSRTDRGQNIVRLQFGYVF